jgi:hypothetical protein
VDTSIFCYATDLADEGIETVLANIQERGGLGGVTILGDCRASRAG